MLALVEKIKLNPFHNLILNITTIMKNNIEDKNLILKFIKTYMDILTNKSLPLKGVIKEEKETSNIISILKLNLKNYIKDIISLMKLFNENSKPETTATDNLDENKYSKKASEFIGKEISHLKKDKGYPQDRAVAAAINVAKDKGMKVDAKKKKPKA